MKVPHNNMDNDKSKGNVFIEYFKEEEAERIALNMLSMGMDSLDIIKATGISVERLLELRDSMGDKTSLTSV